MFIEGDLREHERTQFVRSIRYSVSALEAKEIRRVHDTAVTIDISSGGLGMIAGYPLESGQVLTFQDEIRIDNITAKTAIVRWADKIISNKYRAGVKFL
jgi:c-di-GMP-binding flagellar brake protein YcgR